MRDRSIRDAAGRFNNDNKPVAFVVQDMLTEHDRLRDGLLAIFEAPPAAPATVLRQIAYDVLFNLIPGDVAAYQIRRLSGLPEPSDESEGE